MTGVFADSAEMDDCRPLQHYGDWNNLHAFYLCRNETPADEDQQEALLRKYQHLTKAMME